MDSASLRPNVSAIVATEVGEILVIVSSFTLQL